MPLSMDETDRQDCVWNIRHVQELLDSGIFMLANARHTLKNSALIDLMICMRDLMHKTAKYAERISFSDDIIKKECVSDVTDAIKDMRDACCHIDSFNKVFDEHGGRGSFLVQYGKGILLETDDLQLKCEYDDDIAFFYGTNRLYLKRHIIRAFEEAKAKLAPHLVRRT